MTDSLSLLLLLLVAPILSMCLGWLIPPHNFARGVTLGLFVMVTNIVIALVVLPFFTGWAYGLAILMDVYLGAVAIANAEEF